MFLDGPVARGVRQSSWTDVAQPLDLHDRRLRVRQPLPVAEFRLPVPAQDIEDLLPYLGYGDGVKIRNTCTYPCSIRYVV